MTWKLEAGIVGAACLVLGTFLTLNSLRQDRARAEPVDHFTRSDYDVFDRDFQLAGTTCEVGLSAEKICMGKSPLEEQVRRGEVLPDYVPILGAEFRIIVETSLKQANLRTVRFGQTLVLMDPETRRVEDVLHLTGPDYISAQSDGSRPKA